MANDSDYITVSQASKLSGYNEEHIRRLLRDGLISGRKFGIVWQVSESSLLAYLTEAQKSEDKRHGPKK
jgi:excisionase family DNA binding protein